MRRRTWMLAAVCAVAWAEPARAATPLALGQGDSAKVALDPAGTAHIVFKSIESPDGATYCRLPRGARACDIRTFLPLDDPKQGPLIFRRPADGALIVVQSNWEHPPDTLRLGTTWARYSFDNGATWQGPVVLATGSWDVTAAALAVDGQSVFTLYPGAPEGVFFQRAPLAGGGGNVGITLEPPSSDTFGTSNGAELAGLADGRLMETNERHDGVNWRFFTG